MFQRTHQVTSIVPTLLLLFVVKNKNIFSILWCIHLHANVRWSFLFYSFAHLELSYFCWCFYSAAPFKSMNDSRIFWVLQIVHLNGLFSWQQVNNPVKSYQSSKYNFSYLLHFQFDYFLKPNTKTSMCWIFFFKWTVEKPTSIIIFKIWGFFLGFIIPIKS